MTTKNLINTILSFVFALSLTIIIEWGLSRMFLKSKSDRKVVILAQIITNPALNLILFLNYNFFSINRILLLTILETIVVIVETLIYKNYFSKKGKVNPFLLSLILNTASVLIGLGIELIT